MRFLLFALAPAALLGCTAAGNTDAELACEAQGFAPGTEGWQVCMDADGARLATGPGSAYWIARESED
jgi:hypothetical protein